MSSVDKKNIFLFLFNQTIHIKHVRLMLQTLHVKDYLKSKHSLVTTDTQKPLYQVKNIFED